MNAEFGEDEIRRILDAVDTIEDCLGRLVDARDGLDRAEYKSEPDMQDIVERRFVRMTEATLDIGETIIVHERPAPPESNPATMRTLERLDILPAELAAEMGDAARFRNILPHTYGDTIDHDIVYDALHNLDRYRNFVFEVREYSEENGALE